MFGAYQKNQIARELLLIVVGCVLYSLSVVLFMDPIHIIPGSVTGIAVVVKALFDIPIGVLNLVVNIPLVVVAMFFLGRKMLVYTALTILLNSVLMDWLAFLPPFTTDMMLASVYGGVLMGIGLGMILKSGATTGGTTVVGRLIVRKHPNIQIGYVLMVGDFIIITAGSFLLKDWNLMLYSLINLYICSVINNKVIYGMDVKTLTVIHTDSPGPVSDALREEPSCRSLPVSPDPKSLLICYCGKSRVDKMQKLVRQADGDAVLASVNLDFCLGGPAQPETKP